MIRLIKSLSTVAFLFLYGYFRKGRLIYLLVPLMLVLSFSGGILADRAFHNPQAETTDFSELKMFDHDLVDNYIGVSFNYQPSISEDGRYVTFSSIKLELDKIKDMQIKLYDNKAKKYVDLPNLKSREGWDLAPSISADGRWIAFQSNRNGVTKWDIYLYDLKDKKLVPLPNLNSIFPDFNPSISPDAHYITFNSVRALIPKVYIYNIQDQRLRPLDEE